MDSKKKELVGRYANGGAEWQPTGEPERVGVHDFPDKELGKAIPYGVYDLGANAGWVSVGSDHDTAAFAVASLRRWWKTMGKALYPTLIGCWLPLMRAGPMGTGSGHGRPNWPASRPRRALR